MDRESMDMLGFLDGATFQIFLIDASIFIFSNYLLNSGAESINSFVE